MTEKFGEVVNQNDPYFDDVFTLFLLHYNIVKDAEGLSIVWNIFFNNYDGQDFTKENMIEKCKEELNKRLAEGVTFSDSLFADDCASILRMYNATDAVEDPEESLGCPMVELGLIRKSANKKGTYVKTPPARGLLDKLAVLYVILDNIGEGKESVSIESLINDPNNIGKVFNLDRVLVNEYLYDAVENLDRKQRENRKVKLSELFELNTADADSNDSRRKRKIIETVLTAYDELKHLKIKEDDADSDGDTVIAVERAKIFKNCLDTVKKNVTNDHVLHLLLKELDIGKESEYSVSRA